MADKPYWLSTVDPTASTPLTAETIEQAMASMREVAQEQMARRVARSAAWQALDLDYDAMSGQERLWCAIAMESYALHPNHMKAVEAIVEKYRRVRSRGKVE